LAMKNKAQLISLVFEDLESGSLFGIIPPRHGPKAGLDRLNLDYSTVKAYFIGSEAIKQMTEFIGRNQGKELPSVQASELEKILGSLDEKQEIPQSPKKEIPVYKFERSINCVSCRAQLPEGAHQSLARSILFMVKI